MTDRLPLTLARRRGGRGVWWRPGLPVHPEPDPDETTLAQLALEPDPAPGWEAEAMHWSPARVTPAPD